MIDNLINDVEQDMQEADLEKIKAVSEFEIAALALA